MIALAQKIDSLITPLRKLANCIAAPLWDLAARLYVAKVFWTSGMLRYKDFANGNFDNQIFLFELEHPVPGLEPELAAHMTMFAELALPVLLALGLFGRVGAAGILIMTAVIEFTYIHATDHILWAFLAGSVFIRGAGLLSLDHLLLKFIRKDSK